MSGWPLGPLLALRDREALAAWLALAAAEMKLRQLQGEAKEARAAALTAAARALQASHATSPLGPTAALLVSGALVRERVRLEAAGHARRAEALEQRARCAGAELERLRTRHRRAATRRELVLQLEAAWLKERAVAAARRAEAALDDRPWRSGLESGYLSASRPAAG